MKLKRETVLEVAACGGLASVFAGLWWIYPPFAMVAVGSVFFGLAVMGYRK